MLEVGDEALEKISTSSEQVSIGVLDARRAMTYLVVIGSDQYIAVMDVLEASVTDLTPAEVAATLAASGLGLDVRTVEARLDKLRQWTAVSARSDSSRILRHADLLARNWRYTASAAGRQVHRFYRTVLAGTPTVREIPLTSLNRIVTGLEALAVNLRPDDGQGSVPGTADPGIAERIGSVFTSHDDLDAALVGAEDALMSLADRFDLDDEHTAELKGLLVDYATRVAAELDSGSARAARALVTLAPTFAELAQTAVASSQARALIEAGALTASRGGRTTDWEGLRTWFDPDTGRAARFSLRLVRSLPGMHANLRRLHSSVGTANSRSRLLALARASLTPGIGTQIFQAAVGDHSWRKLHLEAEDDESSRNPSWHGGPKVPVPSLLRSTGQVGPRGRGGPSRNDSVTRAEVAAARARRAVAHQEAVRRILAACPGQQLDDLAARVALASLMAAARSAATGPRRTAVRDGLACTLVHLGSGIGVLAAPTWQVRLPARVPLFHLPGRRPSAVALAVLSEAVLVQDRGPMVKVEVLAQETTWPASVLGTTSIGQPPSAEDRRPGEAGAA